MDVGYGLDKIVLVGCAARVHFICRPRAKVFASLLADLQSVGGIDARGGCSKPWTLEV